LKIDLLSNPTVRSSWIPKVLCGKNQWKICSGVWEFRDPGELLYSYTSNARTGDAIAIFGSPRWTSYTLTTALSILSESARPPEGGAILFYNFINPDNYYSLHVCMAKQKLEIIKRVKGKWATVSEYQFPIEK